MKEKIQLALVIAISIIMVAVLGFPYFWMFQLQAQANVTSGAVQEVVNFLNKGVQQAQQQQGQVSSTSTIK